MKDMKKFVIISIVIIVFLFLLVELGFFDEEDDEVISNSSSDTYTLMVYLCGSDLESEDGYASDDISEMLESQIAKEVNLLVYTGGATNWYNDSISDRRNQIFKVENGNLSLVDDSIGMAFMSNPETLIYFLNYAKNNYSANKYGLILWDHGGGAVSGFGYDENEENEEETLTIDELKYALDQFGNKLDFVGFDACLMANVETAYAIRNNANYLVASEELEPGTGWNYKKVINQLSKDTSQNFEALGKTIIDSYIKSNNGFFGSDATLSMINLNEMNTVYSNLDRFMSDIKTQKFDTNEYSDVSKKIKETKSFADGEIDTIDLVDFATKINVSSSNELINSIKKCVVYNSVTDLVEDSNGLSIYFPNKELDYYEKMTGIYRNIGFTDTYTSVINEYVNFIAGGSRGYYSVNNHNYGINENYEQYNWYDDDLINEFSGYYENNDFDASELEVTEKGDYFSLHLSNEQWNNITDIESSVWYDDGEGYIDLGIDSYYETDDDGDLIVSFDGTWIALDGNIAMYEVSERTDKYEKGKIPAYLNDKEVYLIVYWDFDKEKVEVIGAEPMNAYGNTTLYGRGYTKIKPGDKIELLVDYYDYYGDYDDSYILGDAFYVKNGGLEVTYEEIGDGECLVYYILSDIYNNVYYTEPVILY